MDEYTNYLAHFGIMGMRWGVRRYQNSDGSLTSAGRKRYGVKSKKEDKRYYSINAVSGEKTEISKKEYKRGVKWEKRATPEERGIRVINDSLSADPKKVSEAAARYKAANEYLEQRSKVEKRLSGLQKSTTEENTKTKEPKVKADKGDRLVKRLDNASKAAGSIASIYGSYNKIFGDPSEKETVELATAKARRDQAQLAAKRARMEMSRSLKEEQVQNRIKRAKRETITRLDGISDEDLKSWTERRQAENEFLRAVFEQYNYS